MKTAVKTTTTVEFNLTISETQARALDALVGYGIDPFLKVFYRELGKHYMQPHEQGLRDLFDSIGYVRASLNEVDHNRQLLARALAAARKENP